MIKFSKNSSNSRVKVIQKLYTHSLNQDAIIMYEKGRFKKFIKDVVQGTIERRELIDETINKYLEKDLNIQRTDKLLLIIISAAIFELLFKHNSSKNLIIGEYLKTAEFFLEKAQINYLNAILDKLSKSLR
mgnify:CR=1 FL=1